MTLSKDRVRFTIPERRLWSDLAQTERKMKLISILEEVFQIRPTEIPRSDLTIVCRPSQFARFLIKRNDAGLDNGFKELEPQLVNVSPKREIDVSARGTRCENR